MKMKTFVDVFKVTTHSFLIGFVVISFTSCSITNIKNSRLYYDFHKKVLYTDSGLKDSCKKPIIVKEIGEVQLEMSRFNPLRYEIIVEDTAYDRFVSNIENISKYIILPKITADSLGAEKNIYDPMEKMGFSKPVIYCNQLDSQLQKLYAYKRELDTSISIYRNYIENIENIVSVYDYLKSLDSIDCNIVESSIVCNVIDPINCNLEPNNKLGSSSFKVYKTQLTNKEIIYYQKIPEIRKILEDGKKIVDTIAAPKNNEACKRSIKKKKETYNDLYKQLVGAIDDFNTVHKDVVLPNFTKIMVIYEKLQSLAQNRPVFVTKSYMIAKDIQTINIYKQDFSSKTKVLHDQINIHLTSGFRIDVSGGLFVSGLNDEKYSVYSKDSIYKKSYINNGIVKDTIVKDMFTAIYKHSNADVSFGGMIFLQAHSQNSSNFNYGGYLGVGALFNDQTRWTGSCGASFIIGRSQRCFINVGPIISQVDRLAKPYKTDVFYPKSIDNIPISKVWRYSWMLGVSWKIGK